MNQLMSSNETSSTKVLRERESTCISLVHDNRSEKPSLVRQLGSGGPVSASDV